MTEYPRRIASFSVFVAALIVAVMATFPANAATMDSVFDVVGVRVDVTAETAAAARERALGEGQMKAFQMLLDRLVLSDDSGRLPSVRQTEVTALVRDFSVAEEKTSSVRYLASLSYRFKPEDVRRLLVNRGLPFSETRSKPVLVLPVYQSAGALLLWDEPNPWCQAWSLRPESHGLVPLVLPAGDLADIAAIGAEQAVNGDTQRLSAVAARYRADDTLVAQALLLLSPRTGRLELDVAVSRYGLVGRESILNKAYPVGDTESTQDLLRRAAAEVARLVENDWKSNNLMRFGRPAVLAVAVPVNGLSDWLEIQRRLSAVPVVRQVELVMMSRDEVAINLHYIGEAEQLAQSLRQVDLNLQTSGGSPQLLQAGSAGQRQ